MSLPEYTNEPYPGILGNLSTPDKVWKTVNHTCIQNRKKLLFRIILHKNSFIWKNDFADKGGQVTLQIKVKFIRKTVNRSSKSHYTKDVIQCYLYINSIELHLYPVYERLYTDLFCAVGSKFLFYVMKGEKSFPC